MSENRSGWLVIGLLVVGGILYAAHSKDKSRSSAASYTEDRDSDDSPELQFHEYDCTQDCSGHEAGYQWAEEHGISDETDCGGNSESFIEGCKAYVKEQGNGDGANESPDEPDG